MSARDLQTPAGLARVHVRRAGAPRGGLVLGHGAGGGVGARDLVAVADAAVAAGVSVALVEQPYRVAGRRSPAPAHQLDAAFAAVVAALRRKELRALPVVTGGRSSGARVACRTAAATGAAGVLCLAFPLRPPARAGREPPPSRLPELDGVPVPVLVVQGATDPFGLPAPGPGREVAVVPGDHALRTGLAAIAATAVEWLERVLSPLAPASADGAVLLPPPGP
jgi:hypothetical protein